MRRGARPCRHPLQAGNGESESVQIWCPKGDSNPHDLSRYHLKVVRLPIPPSGHCFLRSVAGRSRRIVPADQPPLLPGGAVWTGAGAEFGAGAMTGAEGVVGSVGVAGKPLLGTGVVFGADPT